MFTCITQLFIPKTGPVLTMEALFEQLSWFPDDVIYQILQKVLGIVVWYLFYKI